MLVEKMVSDAFQTESEKSFFSSAIFFYRNKTIESNGRWNHEKIEVFEHNFW